MWEKEREMREREREQERIFLPEFNSQNSFCHFEGSCMDQGQTFTEKNK